MVCHPQPDAALTAGALREHLRITLPKFKVPKYITLTDRPFPRKATRKSTGWPSAEATFGSTAMGSPA